jgi:dTDP-4-amino-4,6-dideoxygalactose transaminase
LTPKLDAGGRIPPAPDRLDGDELLRFLNYGLRSVLRQRIPRFLPGAEAPVLGPEQRLRGAWLGLEARGMSELQAAVALAQWRRRELLIERQRTNLMALRQALEACPAFALPRAAELGLLPHLLPLLVVPERPSPARALLLARRILHRRGIQTESPYPVLAVGDHPRARRLVNRLLLVPCHASLGAREIERIRAAMIEASQAVLDAAAALRS